RHDLEPHEGAIPLALAGRGLGHPALAGLGSHIQRYFIGRNTQPGRAPYSYVLSSANLGFPTDNLASATAIGMHPGAARPLGLEVDASGDISALLARGAVGQSRAAHDALMKHYIARYDARLTRPGALTALRSPRLADLTSASSSIAGSQAIAAVLESRYFDVIGGSECGDSAKMDSTTMSLALATHLLNHPTTPARYVCVVDGGGGYDSHGESSHTQSRNLGHTLRSLMSPINKPGEGRFHRPGAHPPAGLRGGLRLGLPQS
ncbi:MAG: hypothetical protein ABI134_34830, partial [Byssovorax sp.]